MKQITPTEHVLGDTTFYVRPFPAFTAARITGDLGNVLIPILGAVAPFIGDGNTDGKDKKGVLDTDISQVAPVMSQAVSTLDGEKFERLMRELLTDYGNIACKATGSTELPVTMTADAANELFCGDVQDMFILAFFVIKQNFSGFFKKLSTQFGLQKLIRKVEGATNTVIST